MSAVTAADLAGLYSGPKGKRTAKVVRTSRGNMQIRLYAGGRIHARGVTPERARAWVSTGFAIIKTS